MIAAFESFISRLGERTIKLLSAHGEVWMFFFRVVFRSITPPFHIKDILVQIYRIGMQSLSVVALVGVFTGAVMAVQAVYTLSQFGADAYTGSFTALGLIRELGPVLTALMVNGRAGSAVTAELGIMKITEQIDALRSMAVDPLRYLMVPRLIAGIVSVPILTAIFNVIGIAGGYLVSVKLLGLSSGIFMDQIYQQVDSVDVMSSVIKSIFFGLTFAWISCYKGWTCGFGAVGVNRATTESVVTSSVLILILDYFLTSIMTTVLL